MLLAKVMTNNVCNILYCCNGALRITDICVNQTITNQPQDVHSILTGKLALKYQNREMEAMQAVATAHKDRSLHQFETALKDYTKELSDDPLIHLHLSELYDNMLQQNLCRLIEPFSCVEITHVAELIGLERQLIEKKYVHQCQRSVRCLFMLTLCWHAMHTALGFHK
jgi:hypothetical protein